MTHGQARGLVPELPLMAPENYDEHGVKWWK